jgi:hypothetical protein
LNKDQGAEHVEDKEVQEPQAFEKTDFPWIQFTWRRNGGSSSSSCSEFKKKIKQKLARYSSNNIPKE